MDDDVGCMTILGIIIACLILAAIPLWVYVTLGCLLLAGLVLWGLDAAGLFSMIGDWWRAKSADERTRLRKQIWWTIAAGFILALCEAYPFVAIPSIVCIFAVGFWRRRKRLEAQMENHGQ